VAGCAKENYSAETYLAGLKPAGLALACFQNLCEATRNMLSIIREGFELTGFKNLSSNSKDFGAKWLIQWKLNAKLKKKMNLADSIRTKAFQTLPLKPNSNIVCQSL
jgi:hypothetical protein